MNDYEAKQANRKARYKAMAEKMRDRAQAAHDAAHNMAQMIPFGQPILVGHHSEGRDRRFRARIHDTFGKSFALAKKAEYYERKASANSHMISSDDPEAVAKLKKKLEALEKAQQMMKQANAINRKHRNASEEEKISALVAAGLPEKVAREAITPDYAGRLGFPSYSLTNNNANIKRIKDRIKVLEAQASAGDKEKEYEGFTYREDAAENRVMFFFPGKPDDATRALLKRHAFKWSPSRGAWVRQLTNAAKYAGSRIIEELTKTS